MSIAFAICSIFAGAVVPIPILPPTIANCATTPVPSASQDTPENLPSRRVHEVPFISIYAEVAELSSNCAETPEANTCNLLAGLPVPIPTSPPVISLITSVLLTYSASGLCVESPAPFWLTILFKLFVPSDCIKREAELLAPTKLLVPITASPALNTSNCMFGVIVPIPTSFVVASTKNVSVSTIKLLAHKSRLVVAHVYGTEILFTSSIAVCTFVAESPLVVLS